MKSSIQFAFPFYLQALIIVLLCFSCSKVEQDITPLKVMNLDPVVNARDGEVGYDDWVDQVNSIKEDYFGSEDVMALDFDYFYDKYLEVNPGASPTDNVLKAAMKRDFMSVEYVSLEDNLLANPLLTSVGRTALLALKEDILDMLDIYTSYEDKQTFLQTTAEDALEDESLNVAEKATVYLSCVGIETALNPELVWSNFGNSGSMPQSRLSCNFDDIFLDFILIASGAAVTHNAITALGGYDDFIESIIIGNFSGLTVTNLISLSSPALVYIVIGSIAASIIINCWEVIEDFFENLDESFRNFFTNIFGGSADCEEPSSITALALDCSGDHILFTATQGGDDIVAYMWNNSNTIPQDIITQTRSFAFEPTNNSVTIRVTGICSDSETEVEQITEGFNISNLVENDPVTEVIFENVPVSPVIYVEYTVWLFNEAGPDETLTWTGSTGTSIGAHEHSWAKVTFFQTGARFVRATITDICNEEFSMDAANFTVN
jgi:hypothetical protein